MLCTVCWESTKSKPQGERSHITGSPNCLSAPDNRTIWFSHPCLHCHLGLCEWIFYLASWTPLTSKPQLRNIFKAWLGGRGPWLSINAHTHGFYFPLPWWRKNLLNDTAWKQIFKIIHDFPQLCRQVGEQTSASLEAGQLSMPSYTISPPRLPGSQCPPKRHENLSLFFFFCCLNGWFSAFVSSCIEELGLPVRSSCNTAFKVIYVAQLTISFKIGFHPAIIAGYSSCFCREVVSDSSCPTLSHTQLNKVLVGIQFLTVNCWPHNCFPIDITICCHGKDCLIFGLNATEVIQFPCGKITQSKLPCEVRKLFFPEIVNRAEHPNKSKTKTSPQGIPYYVVSFPQ